MLSRRLPIQEKKGIADVALKNNMVETP
jgi:hypothetical protein